MMYPDFRSEVADETGRLVYEASILFLFACQSGNLNAVQYLIKLNGNLAESVDNFGDTWRSANVCTPRFGITRDSMVRST